jgi:hypothetical protein
MAMNHRLFSMPQIFFDEGIKKGLALKKKDEGET